MNVRSHLADDMRSKWAESGYLRLELGECPQELADMTTYYDSLTVSGIPLWSAFDLVAAPRSALRNLCLCNGEFASPTHRVPSAFRYVIVGSSVEWLTGPGMEGQKVGHVMHARQRNSLLEEINDMLTTGRPIYAKALLDIQGRPEYGFHRGLFPFADEDGRIIKLILFLKHAADIQDLLEPRQIPNLAMAAE